MQIQVFIEKTKHSRGNKLGKLLDKSTTRECGRISDHFPTCIYTVGGDINEKMPVKFMFRVNNIRMSRETALFSNYKNKIK